MAEHKTEGIQYLRHAIIQQKKRPVKKFVTISMEQAEKILEQSAGFTPRLAGYDPKRNSERAAALILGLEPKELCKKLDAPDTAKLLNDLAETKQYIKMLEEAGDEMYASSNSGSAKQFWKDARKFRLIR